MALSTAVPEAKTFSVTGMGRRRLFYLEMAIAMAIIVFAGFAPSFYLRTQFAYPALTPLRIVHGTAFTAWIVLFIAQTTLVATRRTRVHRRLGVAAALLAVLMVVLGLSTAVAAAREGHAPMGLEPRTFLAIPFFDMVVFGLLVGAAILYRRRPEAHKRLMLLATVSLMAAPVARLPRLLPTPKPAGAGGPLVFITAVTFLVLIVAAYDVVTRRRLHPATAWGGLLVVASMPLRMVLSRTDVWNAFAGLLMGS